MSRPSWPAVLQLDLASASVRTLEPYALAEIAQIRPQRTGQEARHTGAVIGNHVPFVAPRNRPSMTCDPASSNAINSRDSAPGRPVGWNGRAERIALFNPRRFWLHALNDP